MLLKCQSLAAIRAPSIDSINIYKQAVIWGTSILSWKMWCCMGWLKLFLQLMGDATVSKQLLQSPIFVLVCPLDQHTAHADTVVAKISPVQLMTEKWQGNGEISFAN